MLQGIIVMSEIVLGFKMLFFIRICVT